MPGRPPLARRLTPIKLRNESRTIFRYLSRVPKKLGPPSINWASCRVKDSIRTPFRTDRPVPVLGGIYLSNSDLGLIGLLGAAITAPLSLAWVGPASAYFTFAQGVVTSSQSIGAAVFGSSTVGALAGFITPNPPTLANLNKPCGDKEQRAQF